jgi:energy-coupling factor transporter ATP-binding protein EcfA2
MQARLGFSVAAHLDPDVLLIDEVLAVGDLSFQQKCYARLQEFKRSGVAIAFVSHNMQAISMLSDRVLYLQPGGPPQSGSVGEMVTAYVTTDSASADARVTVTRRDLTLADDTERVLAPVSPGTWLTLELAILAVADLPRAGLALLFHRADGLLVFNGSSMLDGEPPFDLVAGRTWHISVTFRANLLRGTYAVSGHLFEESRRWPAVQLGVLGSFVVAETTRADGVAELEPRYVTRSPAG